jgi:hypothetical protein
MDVLNPLKLQIAERDPTALQALNKIEFLRSIDICTDWPNLSEKTQTILWAYLGKLVVVGNRALQTEQTLAPLQDDAFRKKILESTIKCEEQFRASGKEITSVEDIMAIAKKVNDEIQK